jgi:hypothetical protein
VRNERNYAVFEVSTVIKTQVMVFWVVMPWGYKVYIDIEQRA